jgi:hypothetical protein
VHWRVISTFRFAARNATSFFSHVEKAFKENLNNFEM